MTDNGHGDDYIIPAHDLRLRTLEHDLVEHIAKEEAFWEAQRACNADNASAHKEILEALKSTYRQEGIFETKLRLGAAVFGLLGVVCGSIISGIVVWNATH